MRYALLCGEHVTVRHALFDNVGGEISNVPFARLISSSLKGNSNMARKNKNNRRNAAEIVASFTREDIQATLKERNDISAHVIKITQVIEAMKAAGMSDDSIQVVRDQVAEGTMKRIAYLEYKVRRVAVNITRSQGFKHWERIVNENITMIPTVEEKQKITLSNM